MTSFNLSEWALSHRAIVLFPILTGVGFKTLGQLEDPNFSVCSIIAPSVH